MATAFSIGTMTAEPGTVARGKLGSLYLSDGTQVDIPLMVVHGAHDGPVLWLSAAMHGQELTGIGVLWELFHNRLNPQTLKGTVVMAPLLNPLSFNGGTYFTPQDGYNINRVFPGDPHGLTTARLAHMVLEEGIKKVDYLIDYHCNPDPAMMFSIVKESSDQATWEASRGMAAAFGITTVEMVLKYEAHRTGTMTDTAIQMGKPSLVIELTPWRRIGAQGVEVGARGALNVMKKLGMLSGEQEEQRGIIIVGGRLTRTETTANRGGLLRELRKLGDPVKKGEVVGQILNAYGDPVEDVQSPVDGWILAYPLLGNQAVNTGDILAFYIFSKPEQ